MTLGLAGCEAVPLAPNWKVPVAGAGALKLNVPGCAAGVDGFELKLNEVGLVGGVAVPPNPPKPFVWAGAAPKAGAVGAEPNAPVAPKPFVPLAGVVLV